MFSLRNSRNFPSRKKISGPSRGSFFSGAYEATCDKQGRIILPTNLMTYAQIRKQVTVIGVSNRFEIWDEKQWEGFSKGSLDSYEKIAEELVNLGI